ncbi:MAG: hypothetical protein CMP86_05225 [Gammaproteobacteria bacterium]|nr:hypothetical protein [Gammaproteobacteria bacterium]
MGHLERTYSAIHWRAIVISAILLTQSATTAAAGEHAQASSEFSGPLAVKISQLINDPYAYVDKTVTIVGAVGDVCPARGCWADVIDRDGGSVRFKVPDGELVFTAAMAGDQVTATGVFRAHHLNAEQAIGWLTHLAAERGEVFDPLSHTGGLTVFQLEGDQASLNSEVHSL